MSATDKISKQDKQDLFRVQSLIVFLYFALGFLIHNYLTINGAVSVIGAGSGLALAALLIGGKRYLWMIIICSLSLNFVLYTSPYMVLGISVVNVLEAWVAFFLVTHYSKSFTNLSSLPAYLRLILFGGAAPAIFGAFVAMVILLFADFSPQTNFFDNAIHWWMGDTFGVAIFTPLILAWWQTRSSHFFEKKLLEPILLLIASIAIGQIIFLNLFNEYLSDTPKGYWVFLVITVVALRTGIRGTTFIVTLFAFQALFGAYNEVGFFAHDIARAGLGNYWASMFILSLVGISITTHITALDEAKRQILSLAFYDTLTQLPNRRLLSDRLSLVLATIKRNECHAALLMLDLDNFKSLNDTQGHHVGDLLLVEVANRLRKSVREVDTVARLGGDEFIVALNELEHEASSAINQASAVAEKIRASLAEPYLMKMKQANGTESTIEHRCTSSIGVVVFNEHVTNVEDIFKFADISMYKAKSSGGNAFWLHGVTKQLQSKANKERKFVPVPAEEFQ